MKAQRSQRPRRDSPATASKSGEGRSAPHEADAAEPLSLLPIDPRSIARSQRTLGNLATSRTIARRTETQSDGATGPVPNVLQLIAETAPALLAVIPAPEIEALQKRLAIAQKNQELAQKSNRIRQQFEARYNLPAEGFGDTRDRMRALESGMKPVGGPLELTVSGAELLAADMRVPPPGDIVAVRRFQEQVKQELAAEPLKVRVEGSGPGSRVVLHWRFKNRPHTRGQLSKNDIINGWGFAYAYSELVTNSPERKQLQQALSELSAVVIEASTAHKERSDKNRDQPIVRRVAQFLGGPSMIDVANTMIDAKQNPGKGKLEDRLKELEAPYPRLAIWDTPRSHIEEGRKAPRESGTEIALLAVMRAERSVTSAATQFARYEERVLSGAGVAVKWLERAKTAGKLAAGVATGGYSLGAQALVAGLYTFVQEGAQQVSEVAHGLRDSIDLQGLVQKASVEGAMSLFGAVTQGAFARTLTARFGTKLAADYGPRIAERVIGGAATATSQFYATPANIVLERIISGGEMPGSIEEFADMVVDETIKSVATDLGLGLLPGAGTPDAADTSAAGEPGALTPSGTTTTPDQPTTAGAATQPPGMNPAMAGTQAFAHVPGGLPNTVGLQPGPTSRRQKPWTPMARRPARQECGRGRPRQYSAFAGLCLPPTR